MMSQNNNLFIKIDKKIDISEQNFCILILDK